MANITRIKNNQITDSTITYTKIAPGTLVGSVFNANITLNSNVTIVGNLAVSGTTTTVQSTNTYINDPLVIFNNGYASVPAYDIGILVNRNLTATAPYGSVNAALVWQEAAKGFAAIMTTETGTTQGAINNSGYANVFVGNTYANTIQVRDNTVSSSSSTGALVVTGGVGVGGTVNIGGSLNVSGAFGVTGNLTTTAGGLISGATTGYLYNETATTINMGAAATTINAGNASGTTNWLGVFKHSGNIVAQSTTDSTSLTTGSIVTLGGLAVAKNITASSSVTTTAVATNFSTANARISGGYIDGTSIGSTTANTGAFTTVTTSSTIVASGNIVAASGTASTNTTTGALVVTGGVGISGNLTVNSSGTNSFNLFKGNVGIGPNLTAGTVDNLLTLSLNSTQIADQNSIIHAIGVDEGSTRITLDAFGSTAVSPSITGRRARGTAASPTAVQTGDRLAYFGGRGYGATGFSSTGRAYMAVYASEGWTDSAQGSHIDFGVTGAGTTVTSDAMTIASTGNVIMQALTTSTSTTTGALVVAGGTGIAGNLNVGGSVVVAGNLTVQGTSTTVGTQDLTIQDSIINLHSFANLAPLTTDDGRDIGIKFHYYKAFSGGDAHAGLVWANDTGYLEYYATGSEGSGNTFVGTNYGTIKSGGAWFANSTASSSTSTGALVVTGGAGIGGALYVGGTLNATGALNTTGAVALSSTLSVTGVSTLNGNVVAASGTASTNTTTGALVVVGGTGISGALNVGGNFAVTGTSAHTGASTFASTITASGNIVAGSGTASTNTTTGALVVVGGVGISGVTNHGGNVVISSATDVTSTTTGALVLTGTGGLNVGGNAYVGNNLYIGSGAINQTFANPTMIAVDSGSNYAQIALKNTSSTGSADFAAYGDTGTDAGGWSDMGFTSTGFNDTNYTITKPNDGYFFVKPVSNTYGGNLVLATSETGSYNDVVIGVGSFLSTSEVARFHGNVGNSGYLNLAYTTNSSPANNTGALRVQGGASFTSNVYHGGATILNGSKTAGYDTFIKGASDDTLIWARPSATYDQVLIGNSATVSTLVRGAKLQINSTDSMLLPTGTTAQRPSNTGGSDVTGMFRYNTTLGYIEFYNGTSWQGVSTQFTVITDEQYNGDGSTTAFTLGASATTSATIVSINGVIQIPTLAYSVSGTTLTFTEAPATGDVIDVRRLTTTQSINAIASTNGYMQFSADNNGAYVYTGSSGTAATTYWDTSGAEVAAKANVSVASANTATTVDTFAHGTYRTAKYIVQVTNGANYQAMEALVVSNGTTATVTTYGIVQTNGNLGVLTATVSGSNTLLQFVAANATNNVRIKKDYLLV